MKISLRSVKEKSLSLKRLAIKRRRVSTKFTTIIAAKVVSLPLSDNAHLWASSYKVVT